MKPDRGSLILVLGILSLVVCAPLGIAAFIMGRSDLREIDAGERDPQGRGTTQAGYVCGIIGSILFGLQVIGGVLLLVLVPLMSLASSGGGHPG
ncbi:MAG: DUF4190 domain-containing protein [Phycisphaerales bacterium]|nr:DUF4190 domain-containing protein [Phycisphaerales bacterium]